ncbi:MAG: acyclic terpene utilization AtuA family protein [Alphaproteobacteria bacterium]
MTAVARIRDRFIKTDRNYLKIVGATGQLGYGIPEPAFSTALSHDLDMVGADMGSTDIGPTFLGNGEMATSVEQTERDLQKLIVGSRSKDIPLIIGSAGSAGAKPHLDATLEIVRKVAKNQGLKFRMAIIRADIDPNSIVQAIKDRRVSSLGVLPELTAEEIYKCTNIVGQMGTEAFVRALQTEPDIIIAGRACDTGIYAALPQWLGFDPGPVTHMAKIVECASLCCVPGGRDPIMATLQADGFTLESMNPARAATPMSVAAHSLYEQADPHRIIEPEGVAVVDKVKYRAIDERRTWVTGATWEPAKQLSIKLEGAASVGYRAVLLAGSADPRFIAGLDKILHDVKEVVRGLVCSEGEEPDYDLFFRRYGLDAVYNWQNSPDNLPREIFILGECLASTQARAMAVVKSTKQYLLHHGFPGRLSTSGNIAFPFTPPELAAGPAYRFNAYHLMQVDNLESYFPVEVEEVS